MLKTFLSFLFILALSFPTVAQSSGSWQGTDACIKAIQQKYQSAKDGVRKRYYYTKPYTGVAMAHDCWSGNEVCIKHNSRICCICPGLYQKEYDKIESAQSDEVQKCYEQGRIETERLQQEQEKAQNALKQQSSTTATKTSSSSSSSSSSSTTNYGSNRNSSSSGYYNNTTSSTTNAATQRNQAIINNLNQQLENNKNTINAISNGIQQFGNSILEMQQKKNQEKEAAAQRRLQEEADQAQRKEEQRLKREQQRQEEADRLAQVEQQNKILEENARQQRDAQWSIDKEIIGENMVLNRKPSQAPDNIKQVYYITYQREYSTGNVTLRSYTLNKYSDGTWMLFTDMIDKIGFQLYFTAQGVGQLLGFYTTKKEAADLLNRIKKIAKIKSADDSFLALTPVVNINTVRNDDAYAQLLMDSGYTFDSNGAYAKAMIYYKKAAALGNADAQNNIGAFYENGDGVKQNYTEALKWYQAAANKGLAIAQCNLGNLYEYGYGVKQSYPEAMKWYRKAADQGDADAQYKLGMCYSPNSGLPPNDSAMISWLTKAADQNHMDATLALALQYKFGTPQRQPDFDKVITLLKKAAADSSIQAQNELGNIYANGFDEQHPFEPSIPFDPNTVDTSHIAVDTMKSISVDTAIGNNSNTTINVPRDYVEALKWYTAAANQGNATAMIQIGKMHWLGQGCPNDEEEANNWFNKAVAADSSNAISEIANLFAFGFYGESQIDYGRALIWRKKAAAMGVWFEMINVGAMYKNGQGVDKNTATANTWFGKAIQAAARDKQEARAMFVIGNVAYLSHGRNASKEDVATGLDWTLKAANKNDPDAASSLGYIYMEGSIVKQDKQKAIYWFKKVVSLRDDDFAKQMLKELGASH